MADEYELTPEAKAIFDRLVRAGWLENIRDNPSSPSKQLLWYVDPTVPANSGYNRFMAFYKLYLEFTKAGPCTSDDLRAFESFAKSVLKSGDESSGD